MNPLCKCLLASTLGCSRAYITSWFGINAACESVKAFFFFCKEYVSWYILLGPAGLETNYKLKHVEWKVVNQSKAKHCRAANEVAGEGSAGRPPSCHSLLLKDTAWKQTPFTILDQTAAGGHCCSSSPNQKHSIEAHPGNLCESELLIMAESPRMCLKRTERGTMWDLCAWPRRNHLLWWH